MINSCDHSYNEEDDNDNDYDDNDNDDDDDDDDTWVILGWSGISCPCVIPRHS